MDTAKNFERRFIMALFAKLLVAQQAFIEKLQSMVITLSNGGLIQSENFREGQSGFRIKANGDAEFNNGIFRGILVANNIFITGSVVAGDNFVLRSNNTHIEIRDGNSSPGEWYYLKSIVTFARGTARIYYNVQTRSVFMHNCSIRFFVNGNLVNQLNTDGGPGSLDIALSNNGKTTIDVEALYNITGSRNMIGYGVGIARFELMVRDDPGMFAMLG
jgi:hypothetical protein